MVWLRIGIRDAVSIHQNQSNFVVLGCSSATATVRDTVESIGCKVIEGMEATGIMNAKLSFDLPCNVSFKDCKETSLSQQEKTKTEA